MSVIKLTGTLAANMLLEAAFNYRRAGLEGTLVRRQIHLLTQVDGFHSGARWHCCRALFLLT
jgi:hypothetical protein